MFADFQKCSPIFGAGIRGRLNDEAGEMRNGSGAQAVAGRGQRLKARLGVIALPGRANAAAVCGDAIRALRFVWRAVLECRGCPAEPTAKAALGMTGVWFASG